MKTNLNRRNIQFKLIKLSPKSRGLSNMQPPFAEQQKTTFKGNSFISSFKKLYLPKTFFPFSNMNTISFKLGPSSPELKFVRHSKISTLKSELRKQKPFIRFTKRLPKTPEQRLLYPRLTVVAQTLTHLLMQKHFVAEHVVVERESSWNCKYNLDLIFS